MKKFHYSPTIIILFVSFFIQPIGKVYAQIGPEQLISKPVFTSPDIIHTADLNGDGMDDVIAAGGQALVWWTNTGNSLFTDLDTISFDTLLTCSSIYAVDLDGDLDLDVLTTYNKPSFCGWGIVTPEEEHHNDDSRAPIPPIPPLPPPTYDGYLAWFENLGNGEFGVIQVLDDSLSRAETVYAADLDGDLDAEILLGTALNQDCTDTLGVAAWYENFGNGSFGSQNLFAPLTDSLSVFTIRAADVDGDFDVDVVASYNKNKQVVWFENLGSATFGTQQVIDSALAYNAPYLEIADLDGDLDVDLLLGKYAEIFWVENLAGNFTGQSSTISTNVDNLRDVNAMDIDDDGDIDAMSASRFDNKYAWYENVSNGVFGAQQIVDSLAFGSANIYPIDADGDDQLEIVGLSSYDDEISWYKNLGVNGFGNQRIITPEIYEPRHLAVADMDGDTDNDVVVVSQADDKVTLYENLGSGNFANGLTVTDSVNAATWVCLADLENDDDFDIVATSRYYDELVWFENLENLNFGTKQIISDSATDAGEVIVKELNGDNLQDIVTSSYYSDEIMWYPNLGNGLFGIGIVLSDSVWNAQGLNVVDLDGDQDNDIVVGSYQSNARITWFENLGSGNFSTQQEIGPSVYYMSIVHAVDVDLDNDMDLIYSEFGASVYWLENIGNASFLPPIELVPSFNPSIILAADMKGDAHPELLTFQAGLPVMYEDDGTFSFDSLTIVPGTTSWFDYLAVSDADGDGDNDIFTTSSGDHRVSWFENLYLVTGVEELNETEVQIYPNPTTGPCIVKLEEPAQLQVYNAIGELVLSKKCNVLAQVHLEDKPNGMYIFQFQTSNGPVIKKVLKME